MSDHVVQICEDSDSVSGQSVHAYQSVWMAHWMRGSCKSAAQADNQLSLHQESKEKGQVTRHQPLQSGHDIQTEISGFSKGFEEANKGKIVSVANENPTTSSKMLRKQEGSCETFAMFSFSERRERGSAIKRDRAISDPERMLRSQNLTISGYNTMSLPMSETQPPAMLTLALPESKTLSSEGHFQTEDILMCPEEQDKSHNFEKNRVVVSMSFKEDFMGSTSKAVPHGHNCERTDRQFFVGLPEEVNQTSSNAASKEDATMPNTCCSYSSDFDHKKCNNLLGSRRSGDSGRSWNLLGKNADATASLQYPSTTNNQPLDFVGNQGQKSHTGMGLSLSGSFPPEMTKQEKLKHGYHFLPQPPCSLHDAETMRGSSNFSQTTRQFLITEKTALNLSDGDQLIRDSTISSKCEGKMLSELPTVSQDFKLHPQGVKLQLIESSTESEGHANSGEVKSSMIGLKNESSAETDTMDMDAFKEIKICGVGSSPSYKANSHDILPTFQGSDGEKTESKQRNMALPDINQQLPSLPDVEGETDGREASTSRTQSFDVEHLLSHAKQASNPKSNTPPGSSLGPDANSRWVKRLKSSVSDSVGHGTKSLTIGEASSREKGNKIFSKIMKCGMSTSESSKDKYHRKEQMTLDQSAMLLRAGESSSFVAEMKGQDILLSHSWIRRWCHNQATAPEKKPEATTVHDPQSSKATVFEFQKNQFPSIAAMALVGKAMSVFNPCELTKRGSSVVWNTKEF